MNETDKILVAWAQSNDAKKSAWARARLCARHAGLVHQTARRYGKIAARRHEPEDIVQLGFEGLLKGVARFDLSREVAFSTYVSHWIRASITKNTQQVKPHMVAALSTVCRVRRESPGLDDAEVARRAGVTPRLLQSVDDATRSQLSLDATIKPTRGGGADLHLFDVVADHVAVDAEAALARESDAAALRRAMRSLSEKHQRILEARFGFDGEEKTLKEIGDGMPRRVSRERVRQIETEALERLRSVLASTEGTTHA